MSKYIEALRKDQDNKGNGYWSFTTTESNLEFEMMCYLLFGQIMQWGYNRVSLLEIEENYEDNLEWLNKILNDETLVKLQRVLYDLIDKTKKRKYEYITFKINY